MITTPFLANICCNLLESSKGVGSSCLKTVVFAFATGYRSRNRASLRAHDSLRAFHYLVQGHLTYRLNISTACQVA